MYEKRFQWAKDTMEHKEQKFLSNKKAVNKLVIKEKPLATTLRCPCTSPWRGCGGMVVAGRAGQGRGNVKRALGLWVA